MNSKWVSTTPLSTAGAFTVWFSLRLPPQALSDVLYRVVTWVPPFIFSAWGLQAGDIYSPSLCALVLFMLSFPFCCHPWLL